MQERFILGEIRLQTQESLQLAAVITNELKELLNHDFPEGLMYTYTVTELANRCNTTPHAVRYYTRVGLLQPKRNPDNGYRFYKESEIAWLKFVRQAKSLGYTLKEIKEIMHDADNSKSPCPRVREILMKRIVENRENLEELIRLQSRMEDAIEKWSMMEDGVPDGKSVCHLIESIV